MSIDTDISDLDYESWDYLERKDTERKAAAADSFLAGVLGHWAEAHPDDTDLVSVALDRVATACYNESTQRYGLPFDLPTFYATAERIAGVAL